MIRAWIEAFTAALDLRTAEMRTGISMVEAVAADNFEAQLIALTGGRELAQDAREIALDAARCGLRPDQARDAFNQWLRGPSRRGAAND